MPDFWKFFPVKILWRPFCCMHDCFCVCVSISVLIQWLWDISTLWEILWSTEMIEYANLEQLFVFSSMNYFFSMHLIFVWNFIMKTIAQDWSSYWTLWKFWSMMIPPIDSFHLILSNHLIDPWSVDIRCIFLFHLDLWCKGPTGQFFDRSMMNDDDFLACLGYNLTDSSTPCPSDSGIDLSSMELDLWSLNCGNSLNR